MLYGLLKENAHSNRKNPTEAESVLWSLLRGKQLGLIFRRQYIIDEYIVDFVCLSKQLIVEVDGKYHLTEEQQELDEKRESRLKQLGFSMLRFTNEEVCITPDKVIEKIKSTLNEY